MGYRTDSCRFSISGWNNNILCCIHTQKEKKKG